MCERDQLLQFISEVSFAVQDINLYLDTHPCDKYALKYYMKYRELREQAMNAYRENFGPLLVDHVDSECYWTWISNPCPWKGGK